jgi:hypothetical protein
MNAIKEIKAPNIVQYMIFNNTGKERIEKVMQKHLSTI